MFQIVRQSLKPAVAFTLFFVKTSWYWIAIFYIFAFCMTEYFVSLPQMDPMNSKLLLLCKLGEMVTALVFSLFAMLLIPARWAEYKRNLPLRSLGSIIHKYTWMLVLEGLRVFVWTLLWTLMLIVPGIIKYARFSLVPFVVMLNDDYDKGRLDALKHSENLTRGHVFGMLILLVLITFFDLAYELSSLIPGIPATLEVKFILSLLTLPLSLYSYSLLIEVYGKLEEQFLSSGLHKPN